MHRRLLTVILLLMLGAGRAGAHDPSAYGGLFRSRDLGGTWLNADVGLFLSAALAVSVDPREPNHLLMGTDLGLLRSRNGGRSWEPEAQGLVIGAVFALSFLPDGQGAICVAPGGVFRLEDGAWRRARAPAGAAPARALAFGIKPGRVYLAGRDGLFASDDGGATYQRAADTLPEEAEVTALAVAASREGAEMLLAVAGGRLLGSEDGGGRWSRLGSGLPAWVDTVAVDPVSPGRLWAAGADRVHVSDDLGLTWRTVGQPLPEPGTRVRGIAADAGIRTLVLTTQRGMYRSEDGGRSWALKEGNLPVHLEAGPLVRDPGDPRALYAVFSLLPYGEVWQTALEGGNLLARADPVSLAGGLAFVLLLLIGGGLLVRWLTAHRRVAAPPATLALSRRRAGT